MKRALYIGIVSLVSYIIYRRNNRISKPNFEN